MRELSDPRPGFFRLRLVRGGPWVGAEIRHGPGLCQESGGSLDRSPLWETWIDGKLVREPSPDPVQAGVFRVWESGTEITEAEFRHLTDTADWCRSYAPHEPPANPTQRTKIADLPPDYFLPRKNP